MTSRSPSPEPGIVHYPDQVGTPSISPPPLADTTATASPPASTPSPPPINNKINLGSSPNLYDIELIERLVKLYANYFKEDTDNRYIEIFGIPKNGVDEIIDISRNSKNIDTCTNNCTSSSNPEKQICIVNNQEIIDNARYLLSRCDTLHDFMFGPRSITVKKLKKNLYQKEFRMLNGRIETALNTTEISKDNLLTKIDYKRTLLERLITHSSLNKLEEKLSEFINTIPKETPIYYYTYKSDNVNLTITTPKKLDKVILILAEDFTISNNKNKQEILQIKIRGDRRLPETINLYIKNYNRKVIGGWTFEKEDLIEEDFMIDNNLEILRKHPFYYKKNQDIVTYNEQERTIIFTKLTKLTKLTKYEQFIVTNDSEASLTTSNIVIKSTNYFNNKKNIVQNIPIWSENKYMLNTSPTTSQLKNANTNKSYKDIQIEDKIYIVWTDPDTSEPYLAMAYICEIYDEKIDYVENNNYKNIFIIYQDNNRDNFKLYKNLYNKTTEYGWTFDPSQINVNDKQDEKYTNLINLKEPILIQMVTKKEIDIYKVKTIGDIQEEEIDLANSQQNDIQNLKMKKYYREVTLQKLNIQTKYTTIKTKLNEYLSNLSTGCDIEKNSDEDENDIELDVDEDDIELDVDEDDIELDEDDIELDENDIELDENENRKQSGGDPTIPAYIFDFDKYNSPKQKIKLIKFTELLTKIYNDIETKNLDKIPNKYVKLLKFYSNFLLKPNAKNCILNMINYVYKYDIDDDFDDYNEVPNVKLYYYKYGQDDIEYGWTLFTDMFDIRSKLEDDVFDKYNQNITEYIEDYLNHKNIITFNAIINAENNYIYNENSIKIIPEDNFNYNLATIEFKNPKVDSQFKKPSDKYKDYLDTIKKYFILPNSNNKKIKYCVDTGNKFVTNKQELECNILHEWDSAKNQCKVEDLAIKTSQEKIFPIAGSSEPDDLKFILFSDYKSNFKIEYKNENVLFNNTYKGINSTKEYEKLSGNKLGIITNDTYKNNIVEAIIGYKYKSETHHYLIKRINNTQKWVTLPDNKKYNILFYRWDSNAYNEYMEMEKLNNNNLAKGNFKTPRFYNPSLKINYIYKTVDLLLLAMIDMDQSIRKYSPILPIHTDFNEKIYEDDKELNFPLDIKRSGDACQLIRTKYLNTTNPDTLYIFVTIDELAFLSARLQNIPAILIHYKNYRTHKNNKYELKSYIKLTVYHPYKVAQKIKKQLISQTPVPEAQTPVPLTPSPSPPPPPLPSPPPPPVAPVTAPSATPENFYNAVENFKGERKRKREIINKDTFHDIEEEPESKRRETFIKQVCDNGIGFINTNFKLISAGFKKILNITRKIEKQFSDFLRIKKPIQRGGGPDQDYFQGVDPLLYDGEDNIILKIFEDSQELDISNIYYNTSAYYRFIMDLRNVSDINEIINMTVEFVMYRIALWNLDYDYKYFETEVQRLEGIITSEIISDPHCKKCISQYEYYEAVLKYYLLLQLPEAQTAQTQDTNIPNFDATSDGRDIMCYIMSKPYDMYVKYKNYFSLQYFQASNIDSGIQIPQKSPSPSALTSAQQIQQANKSENKENNRIGIAAGGSPAPAKPQTKPKGPLKLLDYHKKYFPAYEKLYYSKK